MNVLGDFEDSMVFIGGTEKWVTRRACKPLPTSLPEGETELSPA